MNHLKDRTIVNPVSGEKVSFICTASESNGLKTVIEIELQPNGDGPPPHYHKAYSETFKIIEGEVCLQKGKEIKTLLLDEICTVDQQEVHRFSNTSSFPARLEVTLNPGHEGFENAISILFGLSRDGLVSKKGIPKNPIHLAIINKLSDSHFTGALSFISSLLNFVISSKKLQKTQQALIDNYCSKANDSEE